MSSSPRRSTTIATNTNTNNSMDDLDRLLDEAEMVYSTASSKKKTSLKFNKEESEDSLNDDVSRYKRPPPQYCFSFCFQNPGGVRLPANKICTTKIFASKICLGIHDHLQHSCQKTKVRLEEKRPIFNPDWKLHPPHTHLPANNTAKVFNRPALSCDQFHGSVHSLGGQVVLSPLPNRAVLSSFVLSH